MTLSTFPAYEQISSLRYRRGFTLGGGCLLQTWA